MFLNAPAGLIYPGDEGFPDGKTGLNTQWWNLAPRAGVAWDVHGDGRLAVRSSYSMGYDFMAGEYHNINAGAPPFGNRSIITDPPAPGRPLGARPVAIPTPSSPTPNAQYIPFGAFGSMDPDINSPRVQQWNVMVEQQLGDQLGRVGELSGQLLRPALGAVGAQPRGVPGHWARARSIPPRVRGPSRCARSMANLNQRREMSLENPIRSAKIGALDLNTDIGWQKYRGLKLAARHRSTTGVSLNGSYTLSKCEGTTTADHLQSDQPGLFDSGRPGFRRRLLRSGPQAPRVAEHGVRDAGGWQRGRARAGVELAGVGHPQRAIGEPAQHHQRRRQRIHRLSYLDSAARPASAMTSMVLARTSPT